MLMLQAAGQELTHKSLGVQGGNQGNADTSIDRYHTEATSFVLLIHNINKTPCSQCAPCVLCVTSPRPCLQTNSAHSNRSCYKAKTVNVDGEVLTG